VTTARIGVAPDVLAANEVRKSRTRLDAIGVEMLVSPLHATEL
jgi:hypothetical protein